MSIKSKLIVILFLIGLILGGHTGVILWHSLENMRQIKVFDTDFKELLAITETRSNMEWQIKEAMSYLLLNNGKDKKYFEEYGRKTEQALLDWIQAIQILMDLGEVQESTHLITAEQIKKKYHAIINATNEIFELASTKENQESIQLIKKIQPQIQDLFTAIDQAAKIEIHEQEGSYNRILVKLGLIPWLIEDSLYQIEMAKLSIDYFLSIDKTQRSINRQLEKMTEYLILGEEREKLQFEKYEVEVRQGFEQWMEVMHLQAHKSVPGEETDLKHAKEIEKLYNEILIRINKIFELRNNVNGYEKISKTEESTELFFDETLMPKILMAIEDSKQEVIHYHQELLKFIVNAVVQSVLLLLGVSIPIIFFSFLVIREIITSLSELRKGIEIIGEGKLDHRINLQSSDELGQLASQLNQMTEKLQIVLSRERLVRVGEISAGVAHTVRNPLHGAINCTEILQQRLSPDDTVSREMCDLMMDGLNRIEKVTKRLLVLTRDAPLHKCNTDLNLPISDALSFIETRAQKKKIWLVKNLGDMPDVLVDPDRLSEALINLLDNALDACEEGDMVIIKTALCDETRNGSCIWIEDTGQGISEEDQSHIFDPFFTTKPIGKGSGLGLAIARRIIEEHQGEIKLESHVGKGTKFEIFLPSES